MTESKEQLGCIVEIICRIGSVAAIQPDQDFYDAGFVSVNALPLLIELEERFNVVIPDDRFIGARTPQALTELVCSLQ
jgi:acyl carrier protein